jgi:hypothetical protein
MRPQHSAENFLSMQYPHLMAGGCAVSAATGQRKNLSPLLEGGSMAQIIEKSSSRNRIQFSVSDEMFIKYHATLDRAKELRALVEFTKDFKKWFDGQLEQAATKLTKIEQKRVQAAIDKKAASFADVVED